MANRPFTFEAHVAGETVTVAAPVITVAGTGSDAPTGIEGRIEAETIILDGAARLSVSNPSVQLSLAGVSDALDELSVEVSAERITLLDSDQLEVTKPVTQWSFSGSGMPTWAVRIPSVRTAR